MSYMHFVQQNKELLPVIQQIGRENLISFQRLPGEGGGTNIQFSRSKDVKIDQLLEFLRQNQMATNILEIYLDSEVQRIGPKIFKPTAIQCESMENVTMSVKLSDYNQPFPTFIIDFPEKYAEQRIVPDGYDSQHKVDSVIITHNKESGYAIIGTYFSSAQVYNQIIWERDGCTIEDLLIENSERKLYKDSLKCHDDEKMVTLRAVRCAFNLCMLMMELGTKKVGPANPSFYERLKRQLKLNQKKGEQEKVEHARQELRLIPQLYEFEQKITLYQDKRVMEKLDNRETGKRKRPIWHFRAGHWTNQPYGPQSSLRKRILIPPILVNKDLLTGEETGTTLSTYTVK